MSQPRRARSASVAQPLQSFRRLRRRHRQLSRAVVAASMLAGAYASVGTAMGQSFGGTFTWNNATSESWFNAPNWNDGTGTLLPSLTDDTRVNTGGTVLIDTAANGAATAGQLIVGDDVGHSGTINVSAGTLQTAIDMRVGGNAQPPGGTGLGSAGGNGTLIQSGGVVNVGAHFQGRPGRHTGDANPAPHGRHSIS